MEEVMKWVAFFISQIEELTPPEKIKLAKDYVDANEPGLALELILELTSEYDISLTEEFKEKANFCGEQMQIDVSTYL